MTGAQAREIDRLRAVIAAHERELDHRADIISDQADQIARLEAGCRECHRMTPTLSLPSWARYYSASRRFRPS